MGVTNISSNAIRVEEQETKELPDVSLIILNFNGRIHLETCLPSLMQLNYPMVRLEIIVVDNASTDDSVSWLKQKYPEIRLLLNSSNLGFAVGINSGVAIARGKYVAFLNADMRTDKDWLLALVKTVRSDARAVCSGSIVLNWAGDKIDYAGRPNDALNLCPDVAANAQQVLKSADDCSMLFASGGAMLVDREIFLRLGGFDSDYFLYHEDVDLGWRLWLQGYRVLRSAGSIVYHRGGASSKKLSPEFVQGMAQRYALYTLLKNIEDVQLWSILSGVLWFLVERMRWFDTARLSLGDAISNLTCEMETVLSKRAAIQATRVRSDAEIFAICGHPCGFLLSNHKYMNFERYLKGIEKMPSPPFVDSTSVSRQIIQILCHAYNKFNIEESFNQLVTNTRDGKVFLFSKMEEIARRFMPLAWRNTAKPLWLRGTNHFTRRRYSAEQKKTSDESVLSSLKYTGNRFDSFGRVPHLMGRCNICGNFTTFFCNNSANYRESLKCASCLTTSRYRSLAQGILRAVNDITGVAAKSIADLNLTSVNVPLKIYDTQIPFYTETDAYPIPDLISKCKWIEVQKSIYMPQQQLGSHIAPDVTNQNLECLTFPDNTFDIVITSDVMEHVRLDDRAHKEIYRVLKSGGIYIFTVPHNRAWDETLIRVQVTDPDDPSKDVYLLEPEYHGDANSDEGSGALAYRTYGRDIDVFLSKLCFEVEYFKKDIEHLGILNTELYYCRKAARPVNCRSNTF